MMTPRERVKAVINHQKPDVLPWIEAFDDGNLVTWFRQGLPVDELIAMEWRVFEDGQLLFNWPGLKGFSPHAYFGCDGLVGCVLPIDIGPIPRYKLKVLEEDERYIRILTETGAIAKRIRKAERLWYDMPMYTEFPVKDKKTWEEYKKRLDPSEPKRYPKDWNSEEYLTALERYQQGVTMLRFNGFYGFGAELMGIVPFNLAFYKNPELIIDMAQHWEYYIIETIREAVETLKDQIDIIFWWEDMANKRGPLLSPKLFKEFCLPHYKKVTGFLNKNGIDRIMVDCDGNVKPILDLLIEGGIRGLWPLEVNSGMDAVELGKKYGNKLFMVGNLDKREVAKGGEAMKREVDSKVSVLKEMGGYIPGVDHIIHPEFTLEKFREYADYIRGLLPYE